VHYTSSTVRQTDFTWRIFFVELLNWLFFILTHLLAGDDEGETRRR
jgi:hypothetical protein